MNVYFAIVGCLHFLLQIIWPVQPHNDSRFDFADTSYGYPYSESDFIPVELPSGSAVFFNGYVTPSTWSTVMGIQ